MSPKLPDPAPWMTKRTRAPSLYAHTLAKHEGPQASASRKRPQISRHAAPAPIRKALESRLEGDPHDLIRRQDIGPSLTRRAR